MDTRSSRPGWLAQGPCPLIPSLLTTPVAVYAYQGQREQVVGSNDQMPFSIDLLQASQQEPSPAPGFFIWPITDSTISLRWA